MKTDTARETGTRRRIVDAAIDTIRARGADGATARAIAETGGFNQALIYYYFGSLKVLLIAALETASDRRMARYLTEVERIGSLEDLVRVGADLFREDVEAGTVTVVAEIVSACLTHADLRPQVVAHMEPWVALTQRLIDRVVEGSMLQGTLPSRDLAWGLLALYMGLEMLYNLDGDVSRAERLFQMLAALTPMADPLLGRKGTQ